MARPIKETPILSGNDAVRFLNTIEENKTKKASPEELARMRKNYERLKAMAKPGTF